jgi:membrane fusion protein (multidrug efflux system)
MAIKTEEETIEKGSTVGERSGTSGRASEVELDRHTTEDRHTTTEPQIGTVYEEEVETREKRPIYRRPAFLIVLLLILLIGGVFGVRYYVYARSHESTDDAFIEGHIIQVSPQISGHVTKVYVTDNQPVKEGDLLVEIDPRDYEAQLEQAKAALNAAITRQKTAEINVGLTSKTSSAQVQQASAGLQQARQGVQTSAAQVDNARDKAAQAQAQVLTARRNAEQARAQVSAAEAEATRTRNDVARYEQLYSKDEVSRQQLDAATAATQSAAAQLEAARRRVEAADAQISEAQANASAAQQTVTVARSQVGEAQARVGSAQGQLAAANAAPEQVASTQAEAHTASAEVQRAQAAVEQAELNLSYTKIYAPQTGRTGKKAVEVGNYVQPGQALMAIVPDQVWVVANFKETQLDLMRPGQPAEVKVDAYPGKVFRGKVDSVQPGTGSRFSLLPPENASGNYVKVVQRVPVKIVLDQSADATLLLAPGMSVEPEVKVR